MNVESNLSFPCPNLYDSDTVLIENCVFLQKKKKACLFCLTKFILVAKEKSFWRDFNGYWSLLLLRVSPGSLTVELNGGLSNLLDISLYFPWDQSSHKWIDQNSPLRGWELAEGYIWGHVWAMHGVKNPCLRSGYVPVPGSRSGVFRVGLVIHQNPLCLCPHCADIILPDFYVKLLGRG